MDKLIAELEQATEGSRELDYKIQSAIGMVIMPMPPDPRAWATKTAVPIPGAISTSDYYLPPYTTSLDAALTLVPDWELRKWQWRLFHPGYDNGKLTAEHRADIHSPLSSGGGPKWIAFAPTPALALCVAALKARQATGEAV